MHKYNNNNKIIKLQYNNNKIIKLQRLENEIAKRKNIRCLSCMHAWHDIQTKSQDRVFCPAMTMNLFQSIMVISIDTQCIHVASMNCKVKAARKTFKWLPRDRGLIPDAYYKFPRQYQLPPSKIVQLFKV